MIELMAHAKLTWFLEITGVREDGYHELRSEMTTIGLHDVLFVDETGDHLQVLNPFSHARSPPTRPIWSSRALELVGRRAGVRVEKSIPVGGGLGGGSADAAAILRWAGRREPRGRTHPRRRRAVLPARWACPGRRGGRTTDPPVAYERRDITLIVPEFGVSTAACYRGLRRDDARRLAPDGPNALEEPAGRVEPRRSKRRWRGCAPRSVRDVQLAGSGSSMFIEGHLQTSTEVAGT